MDLTGHVLYHAAASPFVRKVEVLIAEAGIRGVERVAAFGTPVDPAGMPVEQNPLGKIPALTRPDGPALYDSRVICRYLDVVAVAGLYPPPPRLWDTLTLEATADGIMDAAVLMVYESRVRPEERRHSPWVEGQWAKVERALDAVETRWLAHLAPPPTTTATTTATSTPDMGQIAMACALGYLDFRHRARDWRAGRPGLAAWEAGFAVRPAMLASAPQG